MINCRTLRLTPALPFAALLMLSTAACSGDNGGASIPSLSEQLARGEKVTARIAYDLSFEGGGLEHLGSTGVQTSRLPDKCLDITYDSGRTETFLLVGGELTVCQDGDCGPPANEDERAAALGRLSGVGLQVPRELFDGSVADLRPRPASTVAGLDAECFEFTDESQVGTICFHSESGVLLSMDFENAQRKIGFTMTVTFVDFDVDDNDFALRAAGD
jgi:hypothetical protein